MTGALVACSVLLLTSAAAAQGLDANVSLMADAVPAKDVRAFELRARLFGEYRREISDRLRMTAAGFAEGLFGDRARVGLESAAIVRPEELHVEVHGRAFEVRAGMSRLVWGRLDEFLPTDVVNPIDLTKFFLEGRAEARMAVAMLRARWLPSDRLSVEGVYVPFFRRGRFDQLAEDTSAFNLVPVVPRVSRAPRHAWSNAQGGVRTSITTGRVDWSVSAYRGFEPFPTYHAAPLVSDQPSAGIVIEERFPRFTMIGGDFETVRGPWGLRGEVAAFVDRTVAFDEPLVVARGRAIEGGLGADRRAGDYRVSASVLLMHRRIVSPLRLRDTEALLVGAIDRSFARETRRLRGFVAYNPDEGTAFGRIIAAFSLTDRVTFEASGGLLAGSGVDALGRLATRDFAYARLRIFY
jgi:hypothetical protein